MIILGLEDKLGQEQSAISRTASGFYGAEAGDLANPREPNRDFARFTPLVSSVCDTVTLSRFDHIQVVNDRTAVRLVH